METDKINLKCKKVRLDSILKKYKTIRKLHVPDIYYKCSWKEWCDRCVFFENELKKIYKDFPPIYELDPLKDPIIKNPKRTYSKYPIGN